MSEDYLFIKPNTWGTFTPITLICGSLYGPTLSLGAAPTYVEIVDGVELHDRAGIKTRNVCVLLRNDGEVEVRACRKMYGAIKTLQAD